MRRVILLLLITLSEAIESENDTDLFEFASPRSHLPVPFGHISKDGYGDPADPWYLPPLDLLDLSSVYVKDSPKVRQLLSTGKYRFQKIAKPDINLDEFDTPMNPKRRNKFERPNNTALWLDFAAIHKKNLSPKTPSIVDVKPSYQIPSMYASVPKKNMTHMFMQNTFDLAKFGESGFENVTTCEEFSRRPDFNPKDVVDIDWVPFHVWSNTTRVKTVAHIHVLTYPTKKLVQLYQDELGPYLTRKIDWKKPKLVLREKSGSKMEILLVAVNRKGLFHGIPYNEIPKPAKLTSIHLPVLTIWFKIVDPYLAMMICEIPYAMLMAVSGNEPTEIDEIIKEAKILNFNGVGQPIVRNLEEEKLIEFLEKEARMRKEKDSFLQPDTDFDQDIIEAI